MSWSVSAIGKPAAVAASIEKQFSGGACLEPEETVRQTARAAIAAALAAQSGNCAIKVTAAGSQSVTGYEDGKPTGYTNYLNITIEPQYGFVE